jgi:metal-responsive CopG/Arc/MetJ family transcriptional regulator
VKIIKQRREGTVGHHTFAVRATISFPADIYQTLEVIAKEKKVSLAWVVREAAEKYIADKWPLFNGSTGA